MKSLKLASAIFCITAMTTVFSLAVKAQLFQQGDANKKTTVTFSDPVEIPGVHLKGYATLPAGTYVFKLVDSQFNRHIVQILSADEGKVYATILAIPNTRVKRTDNTVITFKERASGEPPALRAWFYAGASWGDEFVYPKSRAKELAKTSETPVLYNTTEDTAAEVSEPIEAPTAPAIAQMDAAPLMAVNTAGEDVELSQAVTPPAPEDVQSPATPTPAPAPTVASTSTSAPAELPQTASDLSVMMLGGLLALGGAFSIRMMQRYRS